MTSNAPRATEPREDVDPLQERAQARHRAQLALYGDAHQPGWGRLALASNELLRGALIGGAVIAACAGLRLPAAQALAVMAVSVCGYALGVGLAASRTTAMQVRYYRSEVEREAQAIEEDPTGERAELIALYEAKGLRGAVLPQAVDQICADPETLLKVMMEEELGIFSTRFEHPALQGLWDGASTLLGALPAAAAQAVSLALGATFGVNLACLALWFASVGAYGILRARHTLEPLFESCAVNLAIAAAAGGLSYFAGRTVADLYLSR